MISLKQCLKEEQNMVTTRSEGLHLVGILLRYMSKEDAVKMVKDMDFEIADITDNESLRDSIKMVSEYLK